MKSISYTFATVVSPVNVTAQTDYQPVAMGENLTIAKKQMRFAVENRTTHPVLRQWIGKPHIVAIWNLRTSSRITMVRFEG